MIKRSSIKLILIFTTLLILTGCWDQEEIDQRAYVRRDTRLIVTKEMANKFIENNKPKLETRRHEYFEIMFKDSIKIGLIPDSTIHNYFRITEADADLFLTAYATTEQDEDTAELNTDSELIAGKLKVTGNTNPAQFLGSAVFKEGKMIGTLTVEETRIAQLMNATMEMPSFLASFPDPFMEDYWITARYTQLNDPKIKVDVTQKPPKIRINLPLLVEVLTDHSMVNYAENKDKRDELKEHMKKRIQERVAALIKRTQEEFEGQPFGFSLSARKHFLTIPLWEKYDWMKSYPDAEVEISVAITFGEFGRQSELPSYQRVRD